jgi:ubiquinone/menaquinone biosynthesis C-methylase UbiE
MGMGEIEDYFDKISESYDEVFDALYFKVYDAVTWKYLEPYVPVEPDAVVLDAGGGTARWAIRMAGKG